MTQPDVSLLVPVVDRAGDLGRVFDEFSERLLRLGRTFEFVFVVDGGARHVIPALRDLKRRVPSGGIDIVVLGKPFGEAAALSVGIERARGRSIATLPAFLQVDPDGIETALSALDAGADLVVARRHPRLDSAFNRLESRAFHALLRSMTGTVFHDLGCGFRVMRSEVAASLNLYGDLHRFLPVLAWGQGFRVTEVDLPQHEEDRKLRLHGPGVHLRRVLDLLTVFFLVKFTRKPLRFFGPIGAGLFGVGFLISLYLAGYRLLNLGPIANRPLLVLGVLLMVLGVQTLSIGLLGEMIVFTHAKEIREYRVAEIL